MTKLNNKGWGLGIFLVFIAVFFLAIIMITYIANKNGMGARPIDKTTNDNSIIKTYKEYEILVKEKAIEYQETNYPNIAEGDSFYVNVKKLGVNSKITNKCSGYVKLGKENNIYIYEPYLKCGGYKTNGYISDLDN